MCLLRTGGSRLQPGVGCLLPPNADAVNCSQPTPYLFELPAGPHSR